MRILSAIPLALLLPGCALGTVANTAVQVVTLPVRIASTAVDLATTSQAEADQKRGREMRKTDERRAREAHYLAGRCRAGRALPTDNCGAAQHH